MIVEVIIARISYWLEQCLMDLMYWNDNTVETKAQLNSLLIKLVALTEFMKVFISILCTFTIVYLICEH